jgi:hypothetical protein
VSDALHLLGLLRQCLGLMSQNVGGALRKRGGMCYRVLCRMTSLSLPVSVSGMFLSQPSPTYFVHT